MDEKDIELIDRYVKGELSDAALNDFKKRFVDDVAFAEQVNWQERLIGGIQKQSRKELKHYLQSLDIQAVSLTEVPGVEKKFVFPVYWKYAVAASVAILVAAVFWFNLIHPSPESLYAQYYQPYPNVVATIERNDGKADAYSQAFQWYEDGQYAKAAIAFEQLVQSGNRSDALLFYAGLTALELNQSEKALMYFEQVITNPDPKFYHQTLWYAALAALKSKDTYTAIKYLQPLSGEKGFYGDKAAQLLKEL